MTYELTWGLLIIGIGVSAVLYGISTAQTFYYYRTYDEDPLYTKILTGGIWILNTIHLGFIIHIPWYYLIAGHGGQNDSSIAWSWPASIIVLNLIALPVFTFYARRIWILSGHLWLSIPVLFIGLVHFTCGVLFSARLLASGDVSVLSSPVTLGIAYTAFAAGTATDVGIAVIMCVLLARARTGYEDTDGVINVIMIYTVNSNMITAICVVAGLISNIVAPTTQFELFFVSILPALYANAYLGSLNNRKAIQAQMLHRSHASGDHSYHLGDLRSHHPIPIPGTVVHVRRQTEARKDSFSLGFEHASSEEGVGMRAKGV